MIDRLVLLPSARTVAPELLPDFGEIPSALIPLDGRAAFEYVVAPYLAAGFRVRIAGYQGIARLEAEARRRREHPIEVVNVGPTKSLGETILNALDASPLPGRLAINFADTICPDLVVENDSVLYVDQRDIHRWTTFEIDETLAIRRIVDKDQAKPVGSPLHVFVGVFGFADPARFREELARALTEPGGAVDPFYLAVQRYVAGCVDRRHIFRQPRAWRDLGHLDTYYASKRSHYLGSRFFNEVSVDARRGVIRKTSRETRKFRDEINWYVRLPRNLAYLAPRVLDYRLEGDQPFLELEFYGYPTLNDIFLYSNLGQGIWDQILDALDHVLRAFASYRLRPQEPGALTDAMREMYVVKTLERLARFEIPTGYEALNASEVVINGVPTPGLAVVAAGLEETAQRLDLYRLEEFSIVHGDLCLSNILYDRRHGIVRLIDPRGGFGRFDLYGDPRYDLAKLSHSVLGHYDFILNGQFDITANSTSVNLIVHDAPIHVERREHFAHRLLGDSAAEVRHVRFIEALLFLSMLPLHADRPRAQAAFLTRGLQLFASMARDAGRAEYVAA